MKEVYYKGHPYEFGFTEREGKRYFQLYENGILKHSVEQGELDIRSIVSLILDSYYHLKQANVNTSSQLKQV